MTTKKLQYRMMRKLGREVQVVGRESRRFFSLAVVAVVAETRACNSDLLLVLAGAELRIPRSEAELFVSCRHEELWCSYRGEPCALLPGAGRAARCA